MGKVNYDQHAALLFMENLNMMVPYYLMASYAYYKQDDPIFTDMFFDNMISFPFHHMMDDQTFAQLIVITTKVLKRL